MTTLHFAHANGFPAGSYQTLFGYFPSHWNVLAKPQFGHDSRFPVSTNWHKQVDELITYLDDNAVREPIFLVGHSFGAILSYMVACCYPQRVKGLLMLDPPIIYGVKSVALRAAKVFGLMDRITPAKLARIRRTHWDIADNLEAYFAAKPLFSPLDERSIKDYVRSATTVEGKYRKLTFDHNVEADIFRHFPHNLNQFNGQLQCPSTLIAGTASSVSKPASRSKFVKRNGIKLEMFEGGHLFPMESPEAVAARIAATLKQWGAD